MPLLFTTGLVAIARIAVLVNIEYSEYRGDAVVQWQFVPLTLDIVRRYIGLLFVPVGQTIFHAVSPVPTLVHPRALAAIVTIGLAVGIAWAVRRAVPAVGIGLVWFLALPSLAVSSRCSIRANRWPSVRTYAASVGFFYADRRDSFGQFAAREN